MVSVPSVARSRWGLLILFALLGLVSGDFASRLPALKAALDLSAGRLGLVLLGPALGCVLSTPTSGWVLRRLAPRRWVLAGLAPLCVLLPLVTLTRNPWVTLVGLLVWGWGNGTVDVSTNTEATRLQAHLGRRVLSGFHATYSLGALAGAGLGALAALAQVSPRWQWAAAGAVSLVAGLYAVTLLPEAPVRSSRSPAGEPRTAVADRRRPRLDPRLVALAVMCFASLLSEGAATDWSAIYLRISLGAAPALATMAYAAFQFTMVVGRFSGDGLAMRWGPVRLLRAVVLLGGLGLGAGLVAADPSVAIVGFALLGIGLSVSFPLAITAAAGLGRTGSSVAVVTSCGYVGLLSGPALLGGLASAVGLPVALSLVVALCLLMAALAGALRGGDDGDGADLVSPAAESLQTFG